jgi:hypothetical protein
LNSRFVPSTRTLVVGLLALTSTATALAQAPASTTPQIPYWSQWTGKDGQTHTTQCYLSNLKSDAFASTPQFVQRLPGDVESLVFTQLPAGWAGKWHKNPKRQWVIVLSGKYYMETSDGKGVTLKAGDVFFGGDQGATASADEPSKVGHTSRVVGNEPSNHEIIQLKDTPGGNPTGVPCPF